MARQSENRPGIGQLNETPLHASLKAWYQRPGDLLEAPVEGYVADILRGDELIEIQTRSFGSMGRKLDGLLDRYRVRLVHPIAQARWIVKEDADGVRLSRRKGRERGAPADIAVELTAFPSLLGPPNLTIEIALVHDEEVRRPGRGARRLRGWRIHERRLVSVVDTVRLERPRDLLALVPEALPPEFGTRELAQALGRPRWLAQKFAYCLRLSEVVQVVGRDRSGVRYRLAGEGAPERLSGSPG